MERKTKTWIGAGGKACSEDHPDGIPDSNNIPSLQCDHPDPAHVERMRLRLAKLLNPPVKRRRIIGRTREVEEPWPGNWRPGSP